MKKIIFFTNIFPEYRLAIWKGLINSEAFNLEIYFSQKNPLETLKEDNLIAEFKSTIEFIPKQDSRVVIDTLLTNGFQVKINHKSLPVEYNIEITSVEDGIKNSSFYKSYFSEINIQFQGQSIFNNTFKKTDFIDSIQGYFWDEAIMQMIWLDDKAPVNNNYVDLYVSFCHPIDKRCKDYKIRILKNGEYKIEPANLSSNAC